MKIVEVKGLMKGKEKEYGGVIKKGEKIILEY